MALNQKAHRRNQEAFEYIKRQKQNQKKYNMTPEKAIEYADTANDLLNDTKTGSAIKNKMYNFAQDKISSLVNKGQQANDSIRNAVSAVDTGGNALNNALNSAKTISEASKNISNIGNATQSLSNAGNIAKSVSDIGNATQNLSNVGNAVKGATDIANGASKLSSVGSSAPVVGSVLGGLSAANNLAKGNYLDAGLDAAATGAMFIPGVGWIASGAIKIGQMIKNAFAKNKAKQQQKSQEELQKNQQLSMQELGEQKQEIAEHQANNQQQMASENPINGQFGTEGYAGTLPDLNSFKKDYLADTQIPEIESPVDEIPVSDVQTQPQEEGKADIVKGIFDKVKLASDIKNAKAPSAEPVGNFAEKGNIDLFNRPVTQNADGTISTVRSMSFNDGKHEVLIPTVADDGAILSEEDAINNYYKTGKHLGKFNSVEDADKYAESLHNQQEKLYDGQMTGGAANINALDMFEDPTVFKDYNKLAREQEQKEGTAPFKNIKYAIVKALRGDTTSDMNGSVLYDYRSPATKEKQNSIVSDSINKEIASRRPIEQPQNVANEQPIKIGQNVQFTPEQQARYNEALAVQNSGNQQIVNDIMNKANIQRPRTLEGSNTGEVLPLVPTAPATPSPSRTNFNPNQFDTIEPDGTIIPAQQAQQSTTQGQAFVEQPTQAQQQVMPYDEKASKVADIMQRIKQGYGENTSQTFNPANMTNKTFQGAVVDANGNVINKDINKNVWNRLGEGVGTAQKILSNPLTQGLVAGALYKATGGDTGESLAYGADWAQKKAKSDFYQKQMDPNSKPGIIGGYTSDDWKAKESIENAKAQQQYSQALLEERRRENDVRIQKMILDMQKNSNTTQDPSFNNTLNGILSNTNVSSERKVEALSKLLRDYSTRGKEQLAYAKNFADLYGIDLGLGN